MLLPKEAFQNMPDQVKVRDGWQIKGPGILVVYTAPGESRDVAEINNRCSRSEQRRNMKVGQNRFSFLYTAGVQLAIIPEKGSPNPQTERSRARFSDELKEKCGYENDKTF